jgi:hypothetical protein
MNNTLIRQAIVVIWLAAIHRIALLVDILLLHTSIAGAHPAHTDIMLIAPPYLIA